MAMDCGEFKELTAAWVLGALEESERAACAAHLASPDPHQGCHDCHRAACAVTTRLAGAVREHPISPRVWTAIADKIRAEKRAAVVARSPVPAAARPKHLAPV
jgi:hypothetical protein